MVWLEQLLSFQTQASPIALCAQTPRSALNARPLLFLSQSSGEKLGLEGKYNNKRNAPAFDKQNRQLQAKKNRLTSSPSFHKSCGGMGRDRELGRTREAGFVLPACWASPLERHPHLQLHSPRSSLITSHLICLTSTKMLNFTPRLPGRLGHLSFQIPL